MSIPIYVLHPSVSEGFQEKEVEIYRVEEIEVDKRGRDRDRENSQTFRVQPWQVDIVDIFFPPNQLKTIKSGC